jgi:two-component system invasion response regulator UvrY
MRLLVIDEHPIVLQGGRQLLGRAGITGIIQAQTSTDGWRLYRRHSPDVIIIELAMRTGAFDGLSFIRKLRLHDQRTPILVYTNQSAPVIASRALEVGATGYVLKNNSSNELLWALQKVRDGKPFISHELASEIAVMEIRGTRNPLKPMTVRELQALAFIAEGQPYRAIAAQLHVSYKTVANTCARLKAKFGVNTLSELTQAAVEQLSKPTSPKDPPERNFANVDGSFNFQNWPLLKKIE